MSHSDALNQLVSGKQRIETEIISMVCEKGIAITPDNFTWNKEREFKSFVNAVSLEIKCQGMSANALFSREQLADSHLELVPEVCSVIRGVVGDLS